MGYSSLFGGYKEEEEEQLRNYDSFQTSIRPVYFGRKSTYTGGFALHNYNYLQAFAPQLKLS